MTALLQELIYCMALMRSLRALALNRTAVISNPFIAKLLSFVKGTYMI